MPNRIIRESARSSPTLAQLSDGAERMFWRLTTVADDHGAFEADTPLLLAACFPLMLAKVRAAHVERWLGEMVTVALVEVWGADGRRYGRLVNWAKHQRVRAEKSKYPQPHANQHMLTAADICGQPRSNAPESESRERESRIESESRCNGADPPLLSTPETNGSHAPISAEPVSGAAGFRIPASIISALGRASILGQVQRLRDPSWWQAELRANPRVDLAAEVLKAEAWLHTNPHRAPRKAHARFMHTWLARAEAP